MPRPSFCMTAGGRIDRRAAIVSIGVSLATPGVAWARPQPAARWTRHGQGVRDIDHAPWTRLLASYVVASRDGVNRVAYGRVSRADRQVLKTYLSNLQAARVDDLNRAQQLPFWINLYNAATIDLVLDHYPVSSIRKIGGLLNTGPWSQKLLTVQGARLSLDDIEHTILRPIWQDVRIHYAVNCASMGCPNLARTAYTAANTQQLLDAGARAYVNHPRGFADVGGRLIASSIYDWYGGDWGSQAAILAHARRYAAGPSAQILAAARRIDGFRYDWSLNDAR